MSLSNLSRLRRFVGDFSALIHREQPESDLLNQGGDLLHELVSTDDWLPDAFSQPDPQHYRQYLLHCDSGERFSVVSFVWGPGQSTPVHNHTVWGLVGVLRGAERAQTFRRTENGSLEPDGPAKELRPGDIERLSPSSGDIHKVSNIYDDRTSISIHIYGANIGAVSRATFDPDGKEKRFISGYTNTELPNLWDRSLELRQQ